MSDGNEYTKRKSYNKFQPFIDDLMAQRLDVNEDSLKVTLYETDPTEWMDDVLCAEFID